MIPLRIKWKQSVEFEHNWMGKKKKKCSDYFITKLSHNIAMLCDKYSSVVNGAPKTDVLKNGLITLWKHHQMQETRNNRFGSFFLHETIVASFLHLMVLFFKVLLNHSHIHALIRPLFYNQCTVKINFSKMMQNKTTNAQFFFYEVIF